MPAIKFTRKGVDGRYLAMTTGPVTFLPGPTLIVSEKLLQELEPKFKEEGIRYRHVTRQELNEFVKQWKRRRNSKRGKAV